MGHRYGCMIVASLLLCGGEGKGQEPPGLPPLRHLASWGGRGNGPGMFREPEGISAGPSGRLYIADTGNNRIQILGGRGDFIGEIGGYGWEREQFDGPVAVSARNGLDVFVADYNNGRVERYDKDLHFLASFVSSTEWQEHLQFGFPMGVDISSQGELFCLDGENRRVLKLDVLGEPHVSFGDFDAGEGRLKEPRRILVPGNGRVYVSDEDRIAMFDVHGNYLSSLGRAWLGRPAGMAFLEGCLLVADALRGSVMVFREDAPVGSFGGTGIRFDEPVDVAAWRNLVYVLDRGRCTVDVFEWMGERPSGR